jgi:hypothetical protein
MKYKYLAAAVYLCITTIIISAPAKAVQISDHYYAHEAPSLTSSGSSTPDSGQTGVQNTFNLLDTIWIFGFTVSGLVLLRKVQGE